MEVKMHELQYMLDFVAAHLALFEPIAGGQWRLRSPGVADADAGAPAL
jgi:hypothetical protein